MHLIVDDSRSELDIHPREVAECHSLGEDLE